MILLIEYHVHTTWKRMAWPNASNVTVLRLVLSFASGQCFPQSKVSHARYCDLCEPGKAFLVVSED